MPKLEPSSVCNPAVVAPPSTNYYAVLDSGATATFVASADTRHLTDTSSVVDNSPTVIAANGIPMHPHLQGILPLSRHLSPTAQHAFALDDLKTGTLISLAQLCDDDCLAIFTKYDVKIIKKNTLIITGHRLPNGLWSLPLEPSNKHQINGILRTDRPKRELAEYHHASLGCPAPSTLLRAIRRGHLTTFPGLTTNLVTKHLPPSIATALGHQDQEAKNLRTTQTPVVLDENTLPDTDLAPDLEPRTHQLCALLFPHSDIVKSYSDQTGKFPIPSSRGNHYIFILYHQDTNTIHATALPNRKAASIRNAWETTHKILRNHGHAPTLHILDNECSQDLKDAFLKYNVDFQRVPPKEHRTNAAERAIRTFKNHFVSILCTVDSNFPLSEWDRLLPQAILTLNLLRSSRVHPTLSAHASLFGNFDYNRTPLAPLGTKIVAHVAADSRTTFGQHGKVGWYIGPSLEHYRCYRCYFPDTMHERDVLKVDFFPEKIPFPSLTRESYLQQTAEDMLALLQPLSPTDPPLAFGPPILNAFSRVAQILGRAIQPPIPATPVAVPASPPRVPIPTSPPPVATPPVSPPRVPPPTAAPPLQPLPFAVSPSPVTVSKTDKQHPHNTRLAATSRLAARLRWPSRPPTLLAQSILPAQIPPRKTTMVHDPSISGKIYNPITGHKETIDSLLHGPDGAIWHLSLTNEWGRCTSGLFKSRTPSTTILGNNTMFFILPSEVPPGRKVTYANFVCTMRPGKAEPCRIRMTVGGDRLDAFQDVRSPAVSIVDAKLHLNSTISDAKNGARYCTADLKDFFLTSDMKIYQYMRIHRRYVTPEVIAEHALTDAHFDSKGYLYLEIRKGMYGLKEASILAYEQLRDHLAPFGYHPVRHTPGVWIHDTRPTTFTLAVDDFGIKYFSRADTDHLFHALEQKYSLTKDWSGTSYLGLTINWNYDAGYVDISMPQYVPKALAKFLHTPPKLPQHAPHIWTAPAYGQKIQLASTDDSPLLDALATQRVQAISGTFLYYARAVDPTILVALNEISNSQAKPTILTGRACDMLLDYLATHPDATIRYHASDMILSIIADAAYLVLPNARSRCAGVYFLSDHSLTTPPTPSPNGPVHVLCKTLRGVPSSAAEAETGGLFLNAQEAIPLITALEEMGHKQPITGTPLETDNSTAHDILKAQVRMKRSKAFDMRYHWLKDRIAQNQFNLYWAPGNQNKADYYTKHFPPSHHKLERYKPLRLQRPITMVNMLTSYLRGCVPPIGIQYPAMTSSSSDHHTSSERTFVGRLTSSPLNS